MTPTDSLRDKPNQKAHTKLRMMQFRQSPFFSQYFVPALVLLIALVLFFYPFTVLGNLFWSRTDTLTYYFPTKLYYAENIRHLTVPLWTSGIGSGFPLFAAIQVGMLYPVNLILYFLFSFPVAFNLTILVQLYMAGVFMFIYAKILNFSRMAAFFTALVFMLSGFFMVRIPHQDLLSTCIWLPLMFFLIEKRFIKDDRRYLVAASIVAGLQVLAGSSPSLVLTFSASLIYFVFRFIVHHAAHLYAWKKVCVLTGELFIIFALGIGLASVQLLPTIELYQQSIRKETAETCGSQCIDTLSTGITTPALLFFPNFFGRDRAGEGHADPLRNFWGNGSFQENTTYLGILPLIFMFAAFCVPQKRKKEYVYFFFFLIILSLLLSLGRWGGLYALLHKVPLINAVRAPARFLYIVLFSVSILAGYGFDLLCETADKEKRRRIIAKALRRFCILLSAALILAAIYSVILLSTDSAFITSRAPGLADLIKKNTVDDLWSLLMIILSSGLVWLWGTGKQVSISVPGLKKNNAFMLDAQSHFFGWCFIFIAFIDLFAFGNNFMRAEKYTDIMQSASPALQILKPEKEPYRITALPFDPAHFRLEMLSPLSMVYNVPLAFGIETASIYSTMDIARYETLINGFSETDRLLASSDSETELSRVTDFDAALRLYSLLNVRYIFSDHELASPNLEMQLHTKDLWIYQNSQVLPRAFFIPNYEVIKDPNEILTTLLSGSFDSRKTVLLEETPILLKDSTVKTEKEQVAFTKKDETDMSLAVSTPKSQFLFLSENYYPGWHAFIDGQETKIYRADGSFRAIYVPAGTYEVRFKYESTYLTTGEILSIASVIILIIIFIFFSRRRSLGLEELH